MCINKIKYAFLLVLILSKDALSSDDSTFIRKKILSHCTELSDFLLTHDKSLGVYFYYYPSHEYLTPQLVKDWREKPIVLELEGVDYNRTRKVYFSDAPHKATFSDPTLVLKQFQEIGNRGLITHFDDKQMVLSLHQTCIVKTSSPRIETDYDMILRMKWVSVATETRRASAP